ncbi:hypothetical protein G7K_6285-t1 [Saitoella complicata NRRL Y-17804]|uniref:Uncharacterized protein n=1 Tax=Saitoella complicata (strain BCRC 22490 / CBS 7301 / JCM 7358 / NBRC 10748 / NRRL Y-17804) TaxID=698492 RepID=A0A0E9NQP6_SAICN|nr:hypothetical protein G7K_6285-t1 [Saitoella complicata NRRL Y-17804]
MMAIKPALRNGVGDKSPIRPNASYTHPTATCSSTPRKLCGSTRLGDVALSCQEHKIRVLPRRYTSKRDVDSALEDWYHDPASFETMEDRKLLDINLTIFRLNPTHDTINPLLQVFLRATVAPSSTPYILFRTTFAIRECLVCRAVYSAAHSKSLAEQRSSQRGQKSLKKKQSSQPQFGRTGSFRPAE